MPVHSSTHAAQHAERQERAGLVNGNTLCLIDRHCGRALREAAAKRCCCKTTAGTAAAAQPIVAYSVQGVRRLMLMPVTLARPQTPLKTMQAIANTRPWRAGSLGKQGRRRAQQMED